MLALVKRVERHRRGEAGTGRGRLGGPVLALLVLVTGIAATALIVAGLRGDQRENAKRRLSTHSVSKNGKVTVSVDVANTGARAGDDVVQVYLHDPVASISQPVRRLRGFQRVTLGPGARQTVSFTLDNSDFGFYDNRGKFVVEPGSIDVYAGDSSTANLTQSFTVHG